MKKLALLAISVVALLTSCGQKDYTAFVDPYIGSGGHGHVFVGASVPFGMVQLGPQQINTDWDWCSGYHYSDTLVIGFSHTHLTGTGCGDLGDILVMPYDPAKAKVETGWSDTRRNNAKHIYASLDHGLEQVKPGFYSVELPDYGVKVRLTATDRAGLHEYTFTGDESAILFDLCTGIGDDKVLDRGMEIIDETHVRGFRRSRGWAYDHYVYFAAEFSEPITGSEDIHIVNEEYATSLKFDTTKDKKVLVKIGISAVSAENAAANLAAELKDWNFDRTYADAKKRWNDELGRIDIVPMDEKQQRVFYTAMYHLMIAPSLFSDVNGDYKGADGKSHNCDEKQYTMLSLWDTYRAAYPLFTLINPEMSSSLVSTFMNIHNEQGTLPIWHLQGCETNCMPGNPGVIILADLCLKGYVKDIPAAIAAMKKTSMRDDRCVSVLKEWGYVPFDATTERETIGKCMETAIADGALAKAAKVFGDEEAAAYFGKRSESWKMYYDPSVGVMRGRAKDGSWREPFDPFYAHHGGDFTEGNAWQYTWLVPHDIEGLIETIGSPEAVVEKLDTFFSIECDDSKMGLDVTGLIGQYAHGNEPSHHVAYIYNYVGRQDKCAEKVRQILNELYFDDHSGVCGNEDAGQMSAWYILSACGIYQVDPACGDFHFGSPLVHKATINVGNGKTFTVVAHNNSMENIYIQEVKLNGEPYKAASITYEQIKAGGTLEFTMGPKPGNWF